MPTPNTQHIRKYSVQTIRNQASERYLRHFLQSYGIQQLIRCRERCAAVLKVINAPKEVDKLHNLGLKSHDVASILRGRANSQRNVVRTFIVRRSVP